MKAPESATTKWAVAGGPSKYCQFISKTSAGASRMHFKILQSKTSRSGRDGTDGKIRGKKDQKGSFCHVLSKNRAAPILGEARKQQAALPSDWPLNHHLTRCRLQSAHEWFMIFSRFHLSNLFSNKYPELIPTAATASGTSLQNLKSLKMSSRKHGATNTSQPCWSRLHWVFELLSLPCWTRGYCAAVSCWCRICYP